MDDILNNATDTLLFRKIHLAYFFLALGFLYFLIFYLYQGRKVGKHGEVYALMTLIAISGRSCLACTFVVFSYSSIEVHKHITGHPAHGWRVLTGGRLLRCQPPKINGITTRQFVRDKRDKKLSCK